tara:strand:+ start:552 stop:797 length:246 start_codon:yes stop_codon:yes gene_type:complete
VLNKSKINRRYSLSKRRYKENKRIKKLIYKPISMYQINEMDENKPKINKFLGLNFLDLKVLTEININSSNTKHRGENELRP